MSPAHTSNDPLEGFPDVVAALAAVVPRVPPPPRLKERLDARLREFAREREASFALLSRPADRVRQRVLRAPGAASRASGRPLARVVVSRCEREAAFFCWYLPPFERFSLVFTRSDGTSWACATIRTDGAGDGEAPFLPLPPGPPLASVVLRRASSGETVPCAKL